MSQMPGRAPILVSACLVGVRCRYDGRAATSAEVCAELGDGPLVALCPEELGGLLTPRAGASFVGGDGEAVLDGRARVVLEDGVDVTAQFLEGARRAVDLARAAGVQEAVLKERSPSCACAMVHREGALVPGTGVTAAALRRSGIRVRGGG